MRSLKKNKGTLIPPVRRSFSGGGSLSRGKGTLIPSLSRGKGTLIPNLLKDKKKISVTLIAFTLLLAIFLNSGIQAPARASNYKIFKIDPGDSFGEIISHLKKEGLIKSSSITKIYSLLTGSAHRLKPGLYELSPHLSSDEIISRLTKGTDQIEVRIPEGSTVFEVDEILSQAKIIQAGDLISYSKTNLIEGRLFPDTYKFFLGSDIPRIVETFQNSFNSNIAEILKNTPNPQDILILASIVEKEVPEFEDRKIVAGLLKERIKLGMPLQVDATVCYTKALENPQAPSCYPFGPLDTKINSPYNTYQYKGLPPGPISSPGVSAVRSVLEAKDSPYLFYISDPVTKRTIFAENLENHNHNILVYLKN